MTKQTIVITGATGWLGQETLGAISHRFGQLGEIELALFASSDKEITFQTRKYSVKSLDSISETNANPIDGVIHLAFLTRDKATRMSREEYVLRNLKISSSVASFIRFSKPKWVVNVSS